MSILDCLTQPNPILRENPPKSNKNTFSNDFVELDVNQIGEWDDFTYENLTAAFSDLLAMTVVVKDIAISDDDSQCSISNEDGVDYVMDNYSTKSLRKPIKVATEVLHKRFDASMYPLSFHGRRSGYQIQNPSAPGDDRRAFKPDWVIYQRYGEREASVIGDSKLCYKWKSSDLGKYHNMSASQAKNFMMPLRQIATYCYHSHTPYGFLITSDELVVVKLHGWVKSLTSASNNKQGTVQYRSIKWSENGPGRLTVHLAIWFLTMVALSSRGPLDDFAMGNVQNLNLGVFWPIRNFGYDVYFHPSSGLVAKATKEQAVDEFVPASGSEWSNEGYTFRQPLGKCCGARTAPFSDCEAAYEVWQKTTQSWRYNYIAWSQEMPSDTGWES